MIIHKNFVGGNIKVIEQSEGSVVLENELRDTAHGTDWFYFAFCVEGAEGKTVTFHFQKNRLGYFGPAVSHDLKSWHWLGTCGEDEFTYTFGEREHKVYFAHSMLYHPERFLTFAREHGLHVEALCRSRHGREVPCVFLGEGERCILLTARHHACESTGNYVLEGFLTQWLKTPCEGYRVLCVPFVDYDGVVDGDQGKARVPRDHNRDYIAGERAIYPETEKIREFADAYGCKYGFDFHSPWHKGGVNDCAFIVHKTFEKGNRLRAFGELLEGELTEDAFRYYTKDDFPYMQGWNQPSAGFGSYMLEKEDNEMAFTLETAYFGTPDNVISQRGMLALGEAFARALLRYIKEKEGNINC